MATNRCNRRCGRQRKPGNATVQGNSWNEIHSVTEDGEVELLKLDVEGCAPDRLTVRECNARHMTAGRLEAIVFTTA